MQTRAFWKNYNMTFRDVTHGPSQNGSLWQTCPLVAHSDPSVASYFFDDFNAMETSAGTDHMYGITEDAGKGGTDAILDARGGQYKQFTDGNDDDESYLHSVKKSWILTAGYSLWFEARCAIVEISTNEANFWVGLSSVITNQIADADAGPIGTYDGVGFFKTGGALTTVGFETSNATAQATTTSGWTHASGVFRDYGFHVKTDSTSDTVAVCTPYVDGVAGTARNITLSGLAEMSFVIGVKTGANAGEDSFIVDYVKVVQIRN